MFCAKGGYREPETELRQRTKRKLEYLRGPSYINTESTCKSPPEQKHKKKKNHPTPQAKPTPPPRAETQYKNVHSLLLLCEAEEEEPLRFFLSASESLICHRSCAACQACNTKEKCACVHACVRVYDPAVSVRVWV